MADDVTLNPGSAGDIIAADDIGGVKHQRVKVEYGTDGNATDVSTTNPLPIQTPNPIDATVTGTATVTQAGTVTVAGTATVTQAANPLPVSMTAQDFFLEVARGNISGMSSVQKFGRNNDIDSAAEEDVWAGGGSRAYLSSAETMDVSSTSTNDDGSPGGTGARTMVIEGLDSSYDEISETVTLDGTTTVVTSNSYLRVHRCYIATAGSVGTNDGDIMIDPTTSGSGSRQAFIASGDGQTLISHYTIPNGKTGYMVGGQLSVAASPGSTGVKQALTRMFKRPENGAWRLQADFGMRSDGTSVAPDINYTVPLKFDAKTDIKWVANVDNNNTAVYVQYNLILIDN